MTPAMAEVKDALMRSSAAMAMHRNLKQSELRTVLLDLADMVVIDEDDAPPFEYEYFFKSEPGDGIQIDGWAPVATERFTRPVEELIAEGKVRRIQR